MRTIDKKLVKELASLRSQSITIGLVIAAGVAVFIASRAAYDSLKMARADFYTRSSFAQGFVSLNRAPETVESKLSEVDGIGSVHTRIVKEAVLDFPQESIPSAGKFVSITEGLNTLAIRSGKLPQNENEVIVSEAFANANQLVPGSRIVAILEGKRKVLTVTGSALSPEYVYVFRPAAPLPDDKHYGILWMQRDALESAFDLQSAFNDVIFTFAPGAHKNSVLKRIDQVLENYGGYGAYSRKDLPSHSFLNDEFRQLNNTATLVPLIFLGVAAFLLHIVSTRIVAREREQIATLKALGYSNLDIAFHYMKLLSIISTLGAGLGVIIGYYLGDSMTDLYGDFYKFPNLIYRFSPTLAVFGISAGLLAGVVGATFSILMVLHLQPAQAMRPPLPASFHMTKLDSVLEKLPTQIRMIIRNLMQRPLRTILSSLGISSAVMIMVVGNFWQDAVNTMLEIQFDLLQRQSVTLGFIGPVSAKSLLEISSQNGVMVAEGYRTVPVRLRVGYKTKEIGLNGIPEGSELRRLVNSEREIIQPPTAGIFLNTKVAEKLGLDTGDSLQMEVLEGNRKKVQVLLEGKIDEILGQGAYMDLRSVNRLLGEADSVNSIALKTDPALEAELLHKLKDFPKIAGVTTRDGTLGVFKDTMERSVLATNLILLLFAAVIAVGVVYNTAMIVLSERAFELGSLRILGFTKTEVFWILAGELTIETFAALPLGAFFGYWLAYGMVNSVQTEQFTVPLIISSKTYGAAILTTIGTAIVSFFILYRRIRAMDLISILKTRE